MVVVRDLLQVATAMRCLIKEVAAEEGLFLKAFNNQLNNNSGLAMNH